MNAYLKEIADVCGIKVRLAMCVVIFLVAHVASYIYELTATSSLMKQSVSFILISFGLFLFFSIFMSCQDQEKPQIDSWVGRYLYEEDPLPSTEGVAPTMSWDFAIIKSGENTSGILDVNGLQTYVKAKTQLSGNPNSMYVIHDSVLEGSIEWETGDTLFVLLRKGKSTITTWKRAKPRLSDDFPKSCTCFYLH